MYYFGEGYSFIEAMADIQARTLRSIIDSILRSDNLIARSYISKLSEVQEKVFANIGLELSRLAFFVSDPLVTTSLTPDAEHATLDWSLLNMSTSPIDIILQIPEANLERWRPLVLLLINQLIRSLERRPEVLHIKGYDLPPVLVMLDEFPRIGMISSIVHGLATLRSRGITFALFVQSFSDLDNVYGNSASKVLADLCAFKAVLGAADVTSQKYFSELIGTTSDIQTTISIQCDPKSGNIIGISGSNSTTQKPILLPSELLMLEDIILLSPYGYCRVKKLSSYDILQETFEEYEDESLVAFSCKIHR